MAKTMARIKDGIVVNLEWCKDNMPETATLVETGNRCVMIGDTYEDGTFLRNGEKVLTEAEQLQQMHEQYVQALENAYQEGVNSI